MKVKQMRAMSHPVGLRREQLQKLFRLERELQQETGRHIRLCVYENEVQRTPVFDDIQLGGPWWIKQNVFGKSSWVPDDGLYGNITQWHM